MEEKKISLPDFRNIDEMAHFFDNNSPLDVEGFEEVNIKFVKAKDTLPVRRGAQRRSAPRS
ncbi:MAG: hypothetical protein DDT21_01059 [Syntrophomonadaceae bacterium]|nr:hypothetical protein [Bacillota bacterium]